MTNYRYVPIKERKVTTYVFQITLETDGDGWRAFYIPLEHRGASSWGATQEEAIKHINEVLAMTVDELLAEGEEAIIHTGERQLREGKSKSWQHIKNGLAR